MGAMKLLKWAAIIYGAGFVIDLVWASKATQSGTNGQQFKYALSWPLHIVSDLGTPTI
jgi:hypothetical protein